MHAPPLSAYYHHVQVAVYFAPAEWALFHLYQFMYSVGWRSVLSRALLVIVLRAVLAVMLRDVLAVMLRAVLLVMSRAVLVVLLRAVRAVLVL